MNHPATWSTPQRHSGSRYACMAPAEGVGIGELMRITGMSRPTLYRYLVQHARAGHVVQAGWGRWVDGTGTAGPFRIGIC